jgi:rare lipoprotein A
VPSVRYDLAVSGTGELTPDDGVPGDDGPREIFERGGASWYGIQFHQRKTASGERFDMTAMTAAHKTLPFNTRVCVRSLVNGSEVLVRINDRGPYAIGPRDRPEPRGGRPHRADRVGHQAGGADRRRP